VTKISSGQRAALALSVFLTLNRKVVNGAPFLIFDDPVAHIDDLNVLSFFDYLRETMLKLKRQIFFATASEKVSYLFKKKFDFLGDGFKVHSLVRTDARG
jgi:DNA repair protein SbcC/Rad50